MGQIIFFYDEFGTVSLNIRELILHFFFIYHSVHTYNFFNGLMQWSSYPGFRVRVKCLFKNNVKTDRIIK